MTPNYGKTVIIIYQNNLSVDGCILDTENLLIASF